MSHPVGGDAGDVVESAEVLEGAAAGDGVRLGAEQDLLHRKLELLAGQRRGDKPERIVARIVAPSASSRVTPLAQTTNSTSVPGPSPLGSSRCTTRLSVTPSMSSMTR